MPHSLKTNKYLFVSNVDIKNRKGGWDGLGGKLYDMLSENLGAVQLLDKINPEITFYSKTKSRALRALTLRADFPAFSKARLERISQKLQECITDDIDYLIFHGSTPWIHYTPQKKYCAILDCSFITYMQVYHDINRYRSADIERIKGKERTFFKNAHRIFFTSDWALKETCKQYGLEGNNFKVIGQGPSTPVGAAVKKEVPLKKQFLFIATDFAGKGGVEICNSFQRFLQTYPDYELVIVGQRPPDDFLQQKNIRFLGYINKSVPEGQEQLEHLYLETRALLMMTRKDIAPLVILEAGLYGCPAIANNISAIGEMIKDKETGILIGNEEDDMLQGMLAMAKMSEADYLQMRQKVSVFITNSFAWNEIIGKMVQAMSG